MNVLKCICALAITGALVASGCHTAPKTLSNRAALESRVQSAIQVAKETDLGLQKFFNNSAGYAVFPSVGKGAVGVGGAFGRGELFQSVQMVGYCSLTQATVGLALGGQEYTELIFFETPKTLNQFKSGNYAFSAQASAVALKAGASANAKYENGVAVFTMGQAGLMVEASIGGQKFSFEPITHPVASAAPVP
jgi:hypothetical protein